MTDQTLPKTFDPAELETRWYAHWEKNGLFRPQRGDAEPFTIVNPPPNVTGVLHIGHALDNTLQDIMVRYERLRGKDALWVVGTDHAGIATQMVVERNMAAQGEKRTDLSREDFLARVWAWKDDSGGQITRQLRRLGCSMDWSREQFTMDPHFSKAVTHVFVELHKRGLIYRDKRLVNWDPALKTAISDLEVEQREVQGKFWHFRYPLADGAKTAAGADHIVVATTRPETMLADMAVAVHPEDERYASLVAAGAEVELPITGRRVRIVPDEHADPELGSGAVKITPGHDFNDFEVGRRAGIAAGDMLNMLDAEARVVQVSDGKIPDDYLGMDRFDARKKVVAAMDELGLLGEVEDRVIQTPFGDRGGVVIEPWLTDQWYVDAEKLAAPAMDAVRSGAVEIVPKSWEKTYFNWMENIQPWCVSRQLWWGHRIPAWFDADGNVFVAETEEEARAQAGEGAELTRDEDVLDTWFSSALWPFATLGWPEDGAPLVQKHYPNDLLISGFDILFFWDARMLMQGIEFMGTPPWKRLYLHGLVRAADGSKMSKSKGNTVDPLGLIDQYGADALRFFMAAMESQGRDIKMDEGRVEGYRNFATKLWNAARFAQANGIGASDSVAAPEAKLAVNRWIIGEVAETVAKLDRALADLRFDAAADAIYHFVWDRYCDWYLELIKPVLAGNAGGADETRRVAGWAFDQILVMLHPFMPFVTEELWHAMGDRGDHPLITARWCDPKASVDAEAKREVEWLIALVRELRGAKSELGIPPGTRMTAYAAEADERVRALVERQQPTIDRLARLDAVRFEAPPEGAAVQILVDGTTFALPLEGVIDLDAERARLAKARDAAIKERDSLAKRLDNPQFVEKAKPEAVEKARADHAEKAGEAERLEAALARLS
ncbi:valine--tRNA ligase [Novosphingopyxis iocasae]|uniref:valine--tRNA ligase n=1 Tax=Novosphingopyxis iocasae TaxID=2762729 RepID=UPI0016511562|nr:valine--tRNA ligase [Novosphingopyxis iocasae]